MKVVVYRCPNCKFVDEVSIKDVQMLYEVADVNDIKSFPSEECHMCHRAESCPIEFREVEEDDDSVEKEYIEEMRDTPEFKKKLDKLKKFFR